MKRLEIIYRKNERECNRALSLIDALKEENDTYRLIEPVLTEATIETGTPDAEQYFILPAFLIDGELIHQGAITEEDAKNILNKALE